ncbi:phospholipase A2 family protein [Enterococcus sp. DIV0660C]|uniref:phospholipase A2 family protein n=1 Tax=Enterococcus sp. DIV0660C TaxID=2230880 RepID=UPI001A8C14D1|nr:phospholipase A2 family protein [Enterococcus sp. DIV0660C]MBO0432047.1 phospholipase [Enterococcus sp. DIV0660C]
MKKNILTVLLALTCIFTIGGITATAEVNEKLTPENEDIISVVEQYTYVDNEGNKYFDIESAELDGVEDYIIEIGYVIESFDSTERSISARATFLIYGNYCGYGNAGKGNTPTDDLDTACMYHDYCYIHGGNNTTCNKNFRARLKAIMNSTNKLSYKYAVAAGAYVVFS